MTGVIYTETVVHSAPAQFVDEAPYQLVIVALDGGATKRTARMQPGERSAIGDRVELDHERDGVPFFRLTTR